MSTTTLVRPEYVGAGHYWMPSLDARRRERGEGYDLYLEEMGWRCNCRWCANPYGCRHVERLADYFLERDIEDAIPALTPAQRAIRQGVTLDALMDYSRPAPPTHRVTNRRKVQGGF